MTNGTNFALIASMVALTGTLITLAFTFWFTIALKDRSKSRYDEELRHADISAIRESLESKIAKMNATLLATEERWRDVNHLIIEGQNLQFEAPVSGPIPNSPFLRNLGFKGPNISINPRQVFVLTPFNSDEDDTYQTIKAACSAAKLSCMRGDEENATGDILRHITKKIAQSGLIIANISGRNPNVFYELGIAEAMSKKIIVVDRYSDEVPFNVAARRIVFFRSQDELWSKLDDALTDALIE